MEVLNNFVDMAKDAAEMKEDAAPFSEQAQQIYPYGLAISLSQDELEKLDMEDDCDVGDMVRFEAIAKVTCVTKNDTTEGPKMRVELQIVGIALDGCHDEEDEDFMPAKINPSKMYKG